MAVIIDIADEIVTKLNVPSTFTQEIIATRQLVPRFELEKLKDLTVTVVPKDLGAVMFDRINLQKECRIDVAIQKKLDSLEDSEINPLMDFVEEILNFFNTERVFGSSFWTEIENEPIYSPEHMLESRVFTSVLTITFKI